MENKILEIEKEEFKFFEPEIFGFSEFVSNELNELQNKKIKVLSEKWEEIYLYNVNENKVKLWEGEELLNFSFDFCLNRKDEEIIKLLNKLSKEKNLKKIYKFIDLIFDKAEEKGAVFFNWS